MSPKDDPDEKGIVTLYLKHKNFPLNLRPKDDPDEKGIVTGTEIGRASCRERV